MSSPTVRRVRLGVLFLILAAATTAAAMGRRSADSRPIRVSDRVRLKSDLFGPTWYVIQHWETDILIDNGREQAYMPIDEVVRDTE